MGDDGRCNPVQAKRAGTPARPPASQARNSALASFSES